MGIHGKVKIRKGRKKEYAEGKKKGSSLALCLCWAQDGEDRSVSICFLVTALVEVWLKEEGCCLFSIEHSPGAGFRKLVNGEIFLRHLFFLR